LAKRIPLLGLLIPLCLAGATPSRADDCGLPGVEAVACPWLKGLGDKSHAYGISADGRTVVGSQFDLPARWVDGVFEALGPQPFETGAAGGVSSDGSVVAGAADNGKFVQSFVWTVEGGLQLLDRSMTIYTLSDDGRVIGGSWAGSWNGSWTNALPARWVDGVMEPLPSYGNFGLVTVLSADGSIAAGQHPTNRPLAWGPSGAMIDLMPGVHLDYAIPYAISPDGSIIVGDADGKVVRWDDLVPTYLDMGGFRRWVIARDLSADGSRVVGRVYADPPNPARALIWNEAGVLQPLGDHLHALGVDTHGWLLEVAAAISDDGQTVVGDGTLDGVPQAFVAVLTPTVGLDIRPESSDNHVVVGTAHRVLLAVYGSSQLDVGALDASAFRFGPGAAPVVLELTSTDLNADGVVDRKLIFETLAAGLAPGDTQACLDVAGDAPARVCSHVLVTAGACGLGFEAGLALLPLMLLHARRAARKRSAA
jgi:uncharacterized membrane protein